MTKFLDLAKNNLTQHMGKPWQPLIPLKKDVTLTPDEFKTAVLNSEPVRQVLRFYSNGDPKKEKLVREQIKTILDEIAFKRNMAVIRFLGAVMEKMVALATQGIYVNPKAILKVKNTLSEGKSTVLYLPSHRSYADFVLMSYVCFSYDLEIPAIAAGMGKTPHKYCNHISDIILDP